MVGDRRPPDGPPLIARPTLGWQADVIPITRIDHVQLAMPPGREEDAVAFFEGVLGLAHVPKPASLAERGGCWFEGGDVKVHLGVEEDFRPARKAHPALVVDGLADLVQRLRHARVDVIDDDPIDGYDRMFIHDPFGNRIELMGRP